MLEILLGLLLVAIDQLTKYFAAGELVAAGGTAELLPGLIGLRYVENRGAAFGMLQGGRWMFLVATLIAGVLIVWLLIKHRRTMGFLLRICFSMVLAGAIGNLIDRLWLEYVRDMFELQFMDFAIFNVADICITVGAALLIISILFTRKGKEFAIALEGKKPNKAEESTEAAVNGETQEQETHEAENLDDADGDADDNDADSTEAPVNDDDDGER